MKYIVGLLLIIVSVLGIAYAKPMDKMTIIEERDPLKAIFPSGREDVKAYFYKFAPQDGKPPLYFICIGTTTAELTCQHRIPVDMHCAVEEMVGGIAMECSIPDEQEIEGGGYVPD